MENGGHSLTDSSGRDGRVGPIQYWVGSVVMVLGFAMAAGFAAFVIYMFDLRRPHTGYTPFVLLPELVMFLGLCFAGWGGDRLRRGKSFGATITLWGCLLGLTVLASSLSPVPINTNTALYEFRSTEFGYVHFGAHNDSINADMYAVVFLVLALFTPIALLLLSTRKPDGALNGAMSSPTAAYSADGRLNRWRFARIWLGAFLIGAFWPYLNYIGYFSGLSTSPLNYPGHPESTVFDTLAHYLFALPLTVISSFPTWLGVPLTLIPAIIICVWIAARVSVESAGVRFYLVSSSNTLLFLPWRRIGQCNLISHRELPETIVLRFRLLRFVPTAIAVHAKHWALGDALVSQIASEARRNDVTVTEWFSPRRTVYIGYSLIIAGAAVALGFLWRVAALWTSYVEGSVPLSELASVAAIGEVTALSLLPVVLIGLGLGLLSGYHRASARPALAAGWMLASTGLPSPLLHWLIWMAVYAIHTGTIGPHPHIPLPDFQGWQLCIALTGIVPAFAGAAYLAGVLTGCRRVRSSLEHARARRVPLPANPSKPDGTSAPQRINSAPVKA